VLFVAASVLFVITVAALMISRVMSDDELKRRRTQPRRGPRGEMILESDAASRVFFSLLPVSLAEAGVLYLSSPLTLNMPHRLLIAMGFAALSATCLPEALRSWQRIEVKDECLSRMPLLGRAVSIRWSDVAKIDYHRLRACLDFHAADKRRIRVDIDCKGFSTFISLLANRIPALSREALQRMPNHLGGLRRS
jgi:hypothetical protein